MLSLAGIVPVIKVEDANDAVPLCKALAVEGLRVAEITFRSDAKQGETIRHSHPYALARTASACYNKPSKQQCAQSAR